MGELFGSKQLRANVYPIPEPDPKVIKLFFMLSSAETKILTAHNLS